jgi:hypothetical protein
MIIENCEVAERGKGVGLEDFSNQRDIVGHDESLSVKTWRNF